MSDSNSYRKNERASRAIEAHLGLDAPKPRAPEDRHPRDGGARGERGRRRFERLNASLSPTDQPPKKGKRMIDPSIIFSAVDESAGLDDLKVRLQARGVECEFVQAPGAAAPTGWSLRQTGPAGTWLKGSEVHRDLSLKKVLMRMEEPRQRHRRNPFEDDGRRDVGYNLRRSGGSFMGVLVGLSFVAAIHLTAGFINLIARALARKSKVPAETLGHIDVAEDGTPQFVEPVDLPADAPADQHARVYAARTVMSKVLDQAAEAIKQDDANLLPTLPSDPEVVAERVRVIEQLDQIEPEDDEDNEPYERERPR